MVLLLPLRSPDDADADAAPPVIRVLMIASRFTICAELFVENRRWFFAELVIAVPVPAVETDAERSRPPPPAAPPLLSDPLSIIAGMLVLLEEEPSGTVRGLLLLLMLLLLVLRLLVLPVLTVLVLVLLVLVVLVLGLWLGELDDAAENAAETYCR